MEMADYRQQRLRIANATLLLELDHRFDSLDLKDARATFVKMRDEISKLVSDNNSLSNEVDKKNKMIDEWTRKLSDMRKNNIYEYTNLIRLGGFFETVGMMVKRQYISGDDARGLFIGPVMIFGRNFSRHIEERQNETGVAAGLFEHALFLYDLAVKAEDSR
jgi:hypothetical protein